MDPLPVWLYIAPPVFFVLGIVLIVYRRRLHDDVVSAEKRVGLPKLLRLDLMSNSGGMLLFIGIIFVVVSVGQALLVLTHFL